MEFLGLDGKITLAILLPSGHLIINGALALLRKRYIQVILANFGNIQNKTSHVYNYEFQKKRAWWCQKILLFFSKHTKIHLSKIYRIRSNSIHWPGKKLFMLDKFGVGKKFERKKGQIAVKVHFFPIKLFPLIFFWLLWIQGCYHSI